MVTTSTLVVASQGATEANVISAVNASEGAAIVTAGNIAGIFTGGLTDSLSNLVANTNTKLT